MKTLALLAALASAEPAASPSPDAEAGVKAFAEGRYEDAAEILARAYEDDPRPELLFAWAQAERYAGQCEGAIVRYRQFLQSEPAADVEQMAQDAIEACQEELDEAEPEPEPEPEPELEPEIEPQTAAPPDDSGRIDRVPRRGVDAAIRDPWAHAFTWSGIAVITVGTGLVGEAHRRRGVSRQAIDEQAYRDALEGAPTLSRAGIAVIAGGAALFVAGVVRFSVVAARGEPKRAKVAWQGPGLTWKFDLAPGRARALR
ncbi:MAG: hypothetical protein AAF799_28070 [Myxococcota bacterium]